jgi:hypothetical protein
MEFLFAQLKDEQSGVLHRRQLRACGVTDSHTLARLRAKLWQASGPVAIVLHNGPLTPGQCRWAALLSAGSGAVLAGRTALELAGLTGWHSVAVQLLVPEGAKPALPRGFATEVHHTRRSKPDQLRVVGRPPRSTAERSAICAASWMSNPRSSAGLLAAVVQQRLSTAPRLLEELQWAGRIRHRRLMRFTLQDIDGGAQALTEIDFGRMCRRHGFHITARQVVRLDGKGRRRYLDGVVSCADGKEVAFEVDGAPHLEVLSYWDDMERSNELVIAGQSLLRFPSVIVRTDERRVVDQLRRASA